MRLLDTLLAQLGWPGKLAIVLLALGATAMNAGLRPLEAQNLRLDDALERATRQSGTASTSPSASPSAKLAVFYQFFQREQTETDWLAKLYGIAQTVGVEVRTADYQLIKGTGKLDRYEIALPLAGDYAKVRAFLENALLEIPVLSLDQVSFRRKRVNDVAVEADVRLTLYLTRR